MAQISSAEPEKLFRYASFGLQLDSDLASESSRLAVTLQAFEAACTEPGFQVNTSHLASALRSYGNQCDPLDNWVHQVGRGFQMADWVWRGIHPASDSLFYATWQLSAWATGAISLVSLLPVIPAWLTQLILSLPWLRRRASTPSAGPRDEGIKQELTQPPKDWTEDEIRQWVVDDYKRLPDDQGGEQCVAWARERRKSLGGTILPAIGKYPVKDLGACQYLKIFEDRTVRLSPEQAEGDITQVTALRPGAVVIWNREHPDTKGTEGYTYGHIATVEAVQPEGLWVSQANWPGKPVMFIPCEKLPSLHLIPPDAKALTIVEFQVQAGV